MAFDHLFKRLLRDILVSCDVEPVKVGDLPLEIDGVARCRENVHGASMVPVLEGRFLDENLMEFKSDRDTCREIDLPKLLGYVGLYCAKNGIGFGTIHERVTAWYITAVRPPFLAGLVDRGLLEPVLPGLHAVVSGFPCPCHVVTCAALEPTVDNAPLMLLGNRASRRAAFRLLPGARDTTRAALQNVIGLVYMLYPDEVKDMAELDMVLPPDVRRNMARFMEEIGIDVAVEEIGIDKVIAAVGIDKVIAAVGIDKVIAAVGVDKVIAAVGVREMELALSAYKKLHRDER